MPDAEIGAINMPRRAGGGWIDHRAAQFGEYGAADRALRADGLVPAGARPVSDGGKIRGENAAQVVGRARIPLSRAARRPPK